MTKRINDTHYAYAVTAARVRQIKALDRSDLDRMIIAPSFASALSVLKAKGWQIPEPLSDTNDLLEKQLNEAWDYLSEIAPDPSLFYPFILKNDFHNLKAGIKSILSDYDANTYFVFPSTIPSEQMSNAISRNEFGLLPSPFSELGKEVYDILVRTENGQLSDIIIDRFALDETLSCAKRGADPLILALI
ncbi:MAG: V-type ATPase subunit, partial [Clostridiales bacterium]|nr:V-type ATPase subunit [Clostridiales bacterium]